MVGATAFGGPAAHIAIVHDQVVKRRKWLSERSYLDFIGASNLIPGPSSTEVVMHVGYERAGLAGLVVAGTCFIVPAALIVLVLAWAYVEYGATPAARSILYGVEPVVIAIVAGALLSLGRTALKDAFLAVVGLVVLALYLLGGNELALLLGGGAFVTVVRVFRSGGGAGVPLILAPGIVLGGAAASPVDLERLFYVFLKLGAVIFGSGYVLLAFLRGDLVQDLGWLNDGQLIDAVAIGQVTPGPVFTTATFIGYVLAGFPGAALATLGIFLPSFLFVAVSNPLIPKLRTSRVMTAFLDGVNVCAVALMAGVTVQLARRALVDPLTIVVAAVAAVLLLRTRVNSVWLVLAGALIGLLFAL